MQTYENRIDSIKSIAYYVHGYVLFYSLEERILSTSFIGMATLFSQGKKG